MSGTAIQWRGGSTSNVAAFTGAAREVVVDTTKQTLVVQDGATAGGFSLAREDLSNVKTSNLTTEATIASAATTDLGTLSSNLAQITGTTAITSLGSSASAAKPIYFVRFAASLTLTYNATSLILPGAANITTAAGDTAIFEYLGSGNWQCRQYTRASGAPLSYTGAETTLASAATCDLGTAGSNVVQITGTTGITSLGSSASSSNPLFSVRFAAALTLTHNGASLILPGAANITTAANDAAIFEYLGSGNWLCREYFRASGVPVVAPTAAQGASLVLLGTFTASNAGTLPIPNIFSTTYDSYEIEVVSAAPSTNDQDLFARFTQDGSSYLSDASYAWINTVISSNSGSAAVNDAENQTSGILSPAVATAQQAYGTIRVGKPASSGTIKPFLVDFCSSDSSGHLYRMSGAIRYGGNTNALNGLELFFGGGANITATVRVWARKNS